MNETTVSYSELLSWIEKEVPGYQPGTMQVDPRGGNYSLAKLPWKTQIKVTKEEMFGKPCIRFYDEQGQRVGSIVGSVAGRWVSQLGL